MPDSILTDTKKILGLKEDYVAFDLDIITHINSALAVLNQLGIGPDEAVVIQDENATWSVLNLPANQLSLVKSYLYLKVRMSFDPPATSFLIDAMKNVLTEQETRLSYLRETSLPTP